MTEESTTVAQIEQMLRHDARAALACVRERLDAAGLSQDGTTYQRLLLIKGAAEARLGDTEDGARIMREVRAWAEEHGEVGLLALSHRRMSALFRRVGDPALMLEHAVRAVELVDEGADRVDDVVRADHVLGLADALGASGSYEASIARYHEAAALADRCGDRYLQLAALNNLAYTQYEAGAADEAVVTAERLRAEVDADGGALLRHFGDTIARAYIAVGRHQEAAAVLEPLCADPDGGEDCDALVLALLTLTQVRRLSRDLDAAQSCLDRAGGLIEEYALTGRRIEAMQEQAELHAARGSYRDAYLTLRDFHRADVELRAMERDARARALHAIFEATEARRSSDYFRELSVRDPLTGLHNRRHLDARLADLLGQRAHTNVSLTLGLVDLDHFKRINDTRSHAVGDDVLRRVSGILQEAAQRVDRGLAVRMGGEEFLVLLPGVQRTRGIALFDRLRREIASHPWHQVSEGIQVTASIGVASAPEDAADRRALLEAADKNLYRAKHNGRNAVMS